MLSFGAFSLLAHSVMRQAHNAIRYFDHIFQGNLTDDIELSGRDETGQLLNGLATMQVHVKVMLDEIAVASRAIETTCSRLNAEMMQVVEQHSRVQAVAAATEEFTQKVNTPQKKRVV